MITVAKDSTGDFTSIQAAVDSIKSTPEIIYIKNGIYNERVEIRLDNVTLKGESAKDTIITNNYYARMITANTSSKGVSIKLTVGDKTVAESATLLKNDILQLKNVSINAGSSYTAAAIFQVPESNISAISGATAVISVNGASIGTINIQ